MSRARNFPCGKLSRNARARASRSVGATLAGSSIASRHTIASLFMLRRCDSAEVFNRAYTSSGMFFRVNVVGISVSNHNGTIMVLNGSRVKFKAFEAACMRANHA